LLEDHRAFGDALALALDSQCDFACVGIARSTDECVDLAVEMQPDVIVMDYRLVDGDGLECARRLAEAGIGSRLVMLSGHASFDLHARARAAGVTWFVSKDSPLIEVLDAIRGAAADRSEQDSFSGRARVTLSPRQRDTLQLMGAGYGPAEISRRLFVSIHTARGYVKDVLKLMGASSQLEAVSIALREGFLIPPRIEQDSRVLVDLARLPREAS
jgi:DNA-binding NarL/FixJ family response regulator